MNPENNHPLVAPTESGGSVLVTNSGTLTDVDRQFDRLDSDCTGGQRTAPPTGTEAGGGPAVLLSSRSWPIWSRSKAG